MHLSPFALASFGSLSMTHTIHTLLACIAKSEDGLPSSKLYLAAGLSGCNNMRSTLGHLSFVTFDAGLYLQTVKQLLHGKAFISRSAEVVAQLVFFTW